MIKPIVCRFSRTQVISGRGFHFSDTAFEHFQAMSIMCNLARQAVIDARDLLRTEVAISQMPNLNALQWECFYSQSCLSQVSSAIGASSIPSLLKQTESRFAMDTLNNDIARELFTELWSKNVSYGKLFEECRPKLCMYILNKRNNGIDVVTTLLGLLGGINIFLLRLFTPFRMG